MLGPNKTGARNRSIFATFIAGVGIDELAARYNLAPVSVRAILRSERNKVAVSPAPEYCELRGTLEPMIWVNRLRLRLS
jgi:hypothetical protein